MILEAHLRYTRLSLLVVLTGLLVLPIGLRRAAAVCVGDCLSDGAVTIDEIATLIAIATGQRPVADCGDPNADGEISVEEIVGAVGNSLTGCPRSSRRYLYPAPQFLAGPPVSAADVNGDGAIDIALTRRVLLNNRDGSFSLRDSLPNGAGSQTFGRGLETAPTPSATAVGDFDGDQITDIAVGHPDDKGTIRIVLGDRNCPDGCNTFFTGEPVRSLVAGDFTTDGHVDLGVIGASASGGSAGDMLTIFEGNGDGTFQSHRYFLPEGPSSFRSIDFNRDHLPDLLRLHPDGFTGYLRNAAGRLEQSGFAPVLPYPPPPGPYLAAPNPIAVGDFDGDGAEDFAQVRRFEDRVHLYWGNGDGSFLEAQVVAAGTMPVGVVAGDLNGDGRDDLVTANAESDDLTILQSSGGRDLESRSVPVGDRPFWVVIADVDGDQRDDLLTMNRDSHEISVHLNSLTGSFVLAKRLRVEGIESSSAMAPDLNKDGLADIVINNFSYFAVLIGVGDGTFRAPRVYPALNSFFAMRSGDANGDGNTDLFVPDHISTLGIWLGDGRGEFVGPFNFSSGAVIDDFAVRDIDGDGNSDLLMSGIKVSVGDIPVSGGFVEIRGAGCAEEEPAYSVAYPQYFASNGFTFAVADMNEDQRADLVTGGGNDAAIVLAVADGELGPRTVLPESGYTAAIAVGDLDSNGKPDVVTADFMSDTVSTYMNGGNGAFARRDRVTVGDEPRALAIGDLNGDGRADVVAGHRGGLAILIASDDGHYENAGNIVAELGPRARSSGSPPLLLADFDRNGTLDLAVSLASGIGILSGSGDGHFAEMRTVDGIAATANGLIAGDFDEDGITDLAATIAGSSDVHILRGRGDGTFIVSSRVDATKDPQAIDARDVDGDGHLDLVTADFEGEEVVVLLGRGDGSFILRKFAGEYRSHFLLLRDFDRDGDLDVLTAEGSTVSMHAGMSLRCALPHDPRSLLPGRRCSLSTDGDAQTLTCF